MRGGQEGLRSSWPSFASSEQAVVVVGPHSHERIELSRHLSDAGHRVAVAELLTEVTTAIESRRSSHVVVFERIAVSHRDADTSQEFSR